MKETKSWTVSAVVGFVIVVAIMLFNIFLDQASVTGYVVAEYAGHYRTAALLVFSLIVMGFLWFVYDKLR